MHDIGLQLFEQAAVVRDDQRAKTVLVRCVFDTASAIAQRIDVETRVELVENGDARTQHCQLQCLVALLLATRQVDVERALKKRLIEVDASRLGTQHLRDIVGGATTSLERLGHHIDNGNARNLGWVLHHQMQTGLRTLPCGQRQQIDVVEKHRTSGDFVAGLTHDHCRERALAGAVGAHDGMHFAR